MQTKTTTTDGDDDKRRRRRAGAGQTHTLPKGAGRPSELAVAGRVGAEDQDPMHSHAASRCGDVEFPTSPFIPRPKNAGAAPLRPEAKEAGKTPTPTDLVLLELHDE